MSSQNVRLSSLDGVRGAAAAVVVVHHTLLTVPALSGAYFGAAVPAGLAWLVYSPMHLLWDGSGPVFVFFVLSGLVVPLPALRSTAFSWSAYFPQRLLRLYVPVWGSLLLAYGTVLLVPHDQDATRSQWVQLHAQAFDPVRLLRDGFLLGGAGWANSPLWTLQWEVAFSLLLPLYVLLGRAAQRSTAAAIGIVCGCMLLVGVGAQLELQTNLQALTYLPMFGVGVALGARLEALGRVGDVLRRRGAGAVVWPVLAVGAVLALSSRWWLEPLLGATAYPLTFVPMLLGATAVVVIACACAPARRVLSSRPFAWAGRLSFSLYLVHDPIVVTVALLMPASFIGLPQIVGLGAAVVTAIVFQQVVERPSHRLARKVGALMRRAPSTRPEPLLQGNLAGR